jgi:probable DNA metabolism protein
MSDRSDVIYRYDGSFEGLMCCVFESYAARQTPVDIIGPQDGQIRLLEQKEIVFDAERCGRVLRSIPERIGAPALDLVRRAYLSCLPQKELHILRFLRLGYERGPAVTAMLAEPAVDTLVRAVKHLNNERVAGRFYSVFGLRRFAGGQIEPKNAFCPVGPPFLPAIPGGTLLHLDRTHGLALLYEPYTPDWFRWTG